MDTDKGGWADDVVMPVVIVSIEVRTSIEVAFDLARSVEVHLASTAGTGERAVGGVSSGLLELGDEVIWEARHFGIRQRLTSKITAFDRPWAFRDSQVRGAFRRFDHDHLFSCASGITTMTDRFDFTSPLGWIGRAADLLFLERYMRRFLLARAEAIRAIAEEVNRSGFG